MKIPGSSLLLATAFMTSAVGADSGSWPAWRGPNLTGSIEAGNYPPKWDPAKPLWKAALPGKGTSTPVVHNQRIYVTAPSGGEDAVVAFDFNGKQLWEKKLGAETKPKHRNLASSGNASPVTDGQTLFVYFKSGNFAALDFDGKVKWQKNLVELYGQDQLFWDQGTSPMLTDKHAVFARMHSGESWVAGFDKGTGELKFKEARNYEAPRENDNGYTTPVLFEKGGKKALLLWAADTLTAHDAENGKLLWEMKDFNPQGTGFWPFISTPLVVGDVAVIPVGRDDRGQASVHGIKLGATAADKPSRIWKRDDTGVFVPSPMAYKGRVYLLRNRGEIVCMDPATGKTFWTHSLADHRTPYYASPVIANGILYAAREDGTIFTGRVTDDKFEPLGEMAMGEQIIASPVLVSGRVFIRTSDNLHCFAAN